MQLPWRSSMELSWRIHCHGNPSAGWKRISRHRAFQKGVSLLRTKSRDNVGTVSAVDWSPNILGRVNSFPEPTAHFHSLKIQRSPAGRLSLGDWLGRYRCLLDWASLPNLESGSLLVMIRGLLATVTKGLDYLWRWPWSWVLLLWPCCKACTCGLGARLNSTETIFFKYH